MLTLVQELVSVYYDLISMDHHKGKDSYFTIETVIRPYNDVKYRAFHSGYHHEIGEYGYGQDRANYQEALNDMVGELSKFITEELEFANRVLSESDWGETDKELATKKLEILTKASFDWLEMGN